MSFDTKITRHGFENPCWTAWQASWCQQAFSKPYLVNWISKDTHLAFLYIWYRVFTGCSIRKRTVGVNVLRFLFLFDWISVSLPRAVVRWLMLRLLLHGPSLHSDESLHKTFIGFQLKRYCCKGSYLTHYIVANCLFLSRSFVTWVAQIPRMKHVQMHQIIRQWKMKYLVSWLLIQDYHWMVDKCSSWGHHGSVWRGRWKKQGLRCSSGKVCSFMGSPLQGIRQYWVTDAGINSFFRLLQRCNFNIHIVCQNWP